MNILNTSAKFLDIRDIVIRRCFKKSKPSPQKIQSKLEYYNKHKSFEKFIVVNKDNILQDGYITYLLSKLLGIDNVKVMVK